VACAYCGTVSTWDEAGYADTGRRSLLPEGFTRLYRGATGEADLPDGAVRFEVLGRVRYDFGSGTWDEWYLRTDEDRRLWLTEDDHQLALEARISATVPPREALQPTMVIEVDGVRYMVREVGEATCVGIEGQIPDAILPDEVYPYADAASMDGRLTLGIEYDDEPPTIFQGHRLAQEQVRLDDEGEDW
jgi:hypothetical protein